jgi:DNA-directed RNA polymerase subunit K/omega
MEQNRPITKYEKVRVLGQRASQLAGGAPPTVNIKGMTDFLKIAQKEYDEGTIPICILRTMPGGEVIRISIVPRAH